jgi:hypothetical protein
MDNVGLKICLLETSNCAILPTIFSLVYTKVIPERVQQPIVDFTRPWDDFMIHGVKLLNAKRKMSKLFEKWHKLEPAPKEHKKAIDSMWHITKTKETQIISLAVQQWRFPEVVLGNTCMRHDGQCYKCRLKLDEIQKHLFMDCKHSRPCTTTSLRTFVG